MDASPPAGAQLVLPPLKWVPSPNYSTRTAKVDLIVIHDCEGSYAGSINWFAQKASQVSAHIVLREDGAEATQMVDLSQKAWHACAFNSRSIGVEMAGYSAKGFGASEWQSAANVVAFLLHCYGLPNRWAKGGQGPGFCSHYDLGQAGGGHRDPTTDTMIWTHFCGLVTSAFSETMPAEWPTSHGLVPPKPSTFVPTPTLRAG